MKGFCSICGNNRLLREAELRSGICAECDTQINALKQRKLLDRKASLLRPAGGPGNKRGRPEEGSGPPRVG